LISLTNQFPQFAAYRVWLIIFILQNQVMDPPVGLLSSLVFLVALIIGYLQVNIKGLKFYNLLVYT
jgi:hypothetical protein